MWKGPMYHIWSTLNIGETTDLLVFMLTSYLIFCTDSKVPPVSGTAHVVSIGCCSP